MDFESVRDEISSYVDMLTSNAVQQLKKDTFNIEWIIIDMLCCIVWFFSEIRMKNKYTTCIDNDRLCDVIDRYAVEIESYTKKHGVSHDAMHGSLMDYAEELWTIL